jgi:hypothetical protein
MCNLSNQEEKLKDLYAVLKEEWTTAQQTNFTPRCVVGQLSILLGCKSVAIFFNPEVVKYLVDLGYPDDQITFFSDDELKQEIFFQDINCKVLPFNKENVMKYKKHFDGGSINPAFAISKEMRKIAESMVKGKLLVVTPNRDLEDEKYLQNVCYFKNFLNTAFEEEIYTSLLIVDTENTPEIITIESTTGKQIMEVTDIKNIPGDDLDAWLFGEKVMNLNLPGYTSYLNQGFYAQDHDYSGEDGINMIFKVGGYEDTNSYGLVKKVDPIHSPKLKGIDKHKLVVSRIGGIFRRSVAKYAPPGTVGSHTACSIDFDSKEEAYDAINYYNSDKVLKLLKGIKTMKSNGAKLFSMIPHHMYSDQWDENL